MKNAFKDGNGGYTIIENRKQLWETLFNTQHSRWKEHIDLQNSVERLQKLIIIVLGISALQFIAIGVMFGIIVAKIAL